MELVTFRDYVERSISLDVQRLNHYEKIRKNTKIEGRLKCRKSKNGKALRFYYVSPENKEVYLGRKKIKTLRALQQKRLADEMISILRNNIRLKEWLVESYRNDDEVSVIEGMPRAYRPAECADGEEKDRISGFYDHPVRRPEGVLGTQRQTKRSFLHGEGHGKRNHI